MALPLAVIKQSALQHNLHWMRDCCAQRRISLAPHGKTTMAPEIWSMQMQAGAWGIGFATVFQAAVGVRHGVPRLIIANQVIQPAELDAQHTLFLVDAAWRRSKPSKPGPKSAAGQAVPAHWRIDALNDQHACLRYHAWAPPAERPTLGETVTAGISHPCTTFDKWRWLPVVNDAYHVLDAVSTWF